MFRYFLIIVLFFCSELKAQQTKILDSISFYGWVREHIAAYESKLELQDNSPRVGTIVYRKLHFNWYAKAQLEYGVHFVQGVSFNKDANTARQLIANPFTTAETFSPRLATVELGHPKWGSLIIGKQWGAYYDVGGYTDYFNLFGASSNGVYAGGTDGGWSGTGRADKAILYRNKFKNLEWSLQTQLNGKTANYGLATQYHLFPGLVIGAAYNNAKISTTGQFLINDIGKTNSNFVAGIKYDKAKIYAAFTNAVNNGDIKIANDSTILALPTLGYELLLRFPFAQKWSLETGGNLSVARKYNPYLKGKYRLLQYIAGLNYFITPLTRIYASMRIGDSKFVDYLDSLNVYALGFRFDFEFKTGSIFIK